MASWKKLIVSGSVAELAAVSASVGIIVNTNQQIQPTQAGTRLTGSFTGSFTGDGSNLIGVTATPTFPSTALTDITNSTNTKFFINDDAGNATSGNKQITYGNLLTDLAGTNLAVESTDSLTLASTITGLTSVSATSFTGSLQGSASYATNALSASFATSASLARTAQSASVATTASYATNVQFPQNNVAGASGVTSFFINQDIGLDSSGNRHITWADLLTDIAGTNLASDGDSINLNTTITGLTSVSSTAFSGSFSGSFQGDGSNLTGIASTLLVSGSTGGGTVNLKTQTLSIVGTSNEVETSVSGQTVTVGLPDDVTLTGDLTVGGNDIKMNGGTTALTFSGAGDVAVAGDLTVTGNDIKSSTNTVFTLNGQNATVAGNLTVSGDLTVTGNVSEMQITNLNVEDQFALLASGSGTTDSGIIAASGSISSGSALYHDITDNRWAVAKSIASNATAVTPLEYITTVKLAAGAPSTQEYGRGEMYVNTSDETIWIYS